MNFQTTTLESIAWPAQRSAELLGSLARRSRLIPHPKELPQPSFDAAGSEADTIGKWMDVAAGALGLEAEAIDVQYTNIERFIQVGAPAIIRLPGGIDQNQPSLIAIIKGGKRRVKILTPDLRVRRVAAGLIRSLICTPLEEPLLESLDQLLADAQVPHERHETARKAILQEQMATLRIDGGWILRQPPGATLFRQLRYVGALGPLLAIFGMYAVQQVMAILTWFVIGRGVFLGHYDWGWLFAWSILLFATIPIALLDRVNYPCVSAWFLNSVFCWGP